MGPTSRIGSCVEYYVLLMEAECHCCPSFCFLGTERTTPSFLFLTTRLDHTSGVGPKNVFKVRHWDYDLPHPFRSENLLIECVYEWGVPNLPERGRQGSSCERRVKSILHSWVLGVITCRHTEFRLSVPNQCQVR